MSTENTLKLVAFQIDSIVETAPENLVPIQSIAENPVVKLIIEGELLKSEEIIKRAVVYTNNVLFVDECAFTPKLKRAERKTLILRNIPVDVVEQEIRFLFDGETSLLDKVSDMKNDIGDTYFINFLDEPSALAAFQYLRILTFRNKPISVFIKPKLPDSFDILPNNEPDASSVPSPNFAPLIRNRKPFGNFENRISGARQKKSSFQDRNRDLKKYSREQLIAVKTRLKLDTCSELIRRDPAIASQISSTVIVDLLPCSEIFLIQT
jgi:hypothetical protein